LDLTSQGFGLNTPLSCVSPVIHVVSWNIIDTVREAARLTGLTDRGYDIKDIGAHFLRALGAMALKLDGGASNTTIMKVGRWTSSTFLVYIHLQISVLNAGLAQGMARPVYILELEQCDLLVFSSASGLLSGSPQQSITAQILQAATFDSKDLQASTDLHLKRILHAFRHSCTQMCM
jgi:hypothetical protein